MTPTLAERVEDVSPEVRQGLARINKLRLWLWGTWFAFLPFMAMVGVFQPPEWLLTPLGILWVSTWAVLLVVHGLYRCPACRKFFNWSWYSNPFTSKCLHCGINLYRGMRPGRPTRISEPDGDRTSR